MRSPCAGAVPLDPPLWTIVPNNLNLQALSLRLRGRVGPGNSESESISSLFLIKLSLERRNGYSNETGLCCLLLWVLLNAVPIQFIPNTATTT